jgi:hypothetical protein
MLWWHWFLVGAATVILIEAVAAFLLYRIFKNLQDDTISSMFW